MTRTHAGRRAQADGPGMNGMHAGQGAQAERDGNGLRLRRRRANARRVRRMTILAALPLMAAVLSLAAAALAPVAIAQGEPDRRGPGEMDWESAADLESTVPESTATGLTGERLDEFMLRLSQLTDSQPLFARECPPSPRTPYTLPPKPLEPALGVVFADGRPARWDLLVSWGAESYWPMEECCATVGATLLWDPAGFRGELRIDTLSIRFIVGGEVIQGGERALQMRGPVIYAGNRLLLPLSGVPLIVEHFLADRFSYDEEAKILYQRPAGPILGDLRVQQVSGRTYLRWALSQKPEADLFTEGARTLIVDMHGVFVDPRTPARSDGREGTCLQAIQPDAQGTRFVFRIDAAVIAWKDQWLADRREYQVILSRRGEDLSPLSPYRPWPARGPGGAGARGGAIVVVLPDGSFWADRAGDRDLPLASAGYVEALGRRIETALQARGMSVILLADDAAKPGRGWVPEANRSGAMACLDLRPALCGDSLIAGMRVVTAQNEPLRRHLDPLDLAGSGRRSERPGPEGDGRAALQSWDDLGLVHQEKSEELAWLLAMHLEAALAMDELAGERPVVWQRWPVSGLTGLDLPGTILYVGRLGPMALFPADEDWKAIETMADAIALALEAYIIRQGVAP